MWIPFFKNECEDNDSMHTSQPQNEINNIFIFISYLCDYKLFMDFGPSHPRVYVPWVTYTHEWVATYPQFAIRSALWASLISQAHSPF